tara:strand:+ start:4672 stop:5832 length:1161 start_codon:yes stop_codon:yes gene_type:complete
MALQFPKGPYMQNAPSAVGAGLQALASIPQVIDAAKAKNIRKELSSYFLNNTMGEGGLTVIDGDLSYQSDFVLPNFQDAWSKYKDVYKKYDKSVGMEDYGAFKQMYSEMAGMHANKLKTDITKFSAAGYSNSEIRNALGDNPVFAQSYNSLISDPAQGANYGTMFSEYAPRKSFMDSLTGSDVRRAALGVAGVGGAAQYLSDRDATKKISEADKILKEYKDSPEYKSAKGPAKAKITRDTKAKVKKMKADANMSASKKLMKQAGRLGKAGPLLGYGLGTEAIRAAGTKVFDDERMGELIGSAGGAAATGAALAPGVPAVTSLIRDKIKKHGLKKVMAAVVKGGGYKLAGSVFSKAALTGTGVGAIIGGGLLASDVIQIYNILKDMN